VDIQPIAIQISKLRFFISLIVDQKVNHQKDNFGIRALPNLETKFVAANTLIGLDKPQQLGLQNNMEIDKLEDELKNLRHQYFSAKTRKEKLDCQKKDKGLREKISVLLVKDGWDNESAKQLSAFDPYDQNAGSTWFDAVWMFGLKEGFDIVIGNPPYMAIQKMKPDGKAGLQQQHFQSFESTGDIYCLFYEKSNDLLKNNGTLCFITSRQWLNAAYGKSLRKFFVEKTDPCLLIDFGKAKIFENATVFVNILLFRKQPNQHHLQTCVLRDDFNVNAESLESYFNDYNAILNDLSENTWKIGSDVQTTINQKIEKAGISLRNWNVNFFRGITTGLNEAFHIDEATKKELIQKNPKNSDIIKPLLRGEDIKRYGYRFKNWHIINSHNGLKSKKLARIDVIRDYPDIYNHLKIYQDKLINRQDQGEHWTNLRNCAFLSEFEQPKIVWIEISDKANYAYDEQGMYLTNSAYFLSGEQLKYLLAVLNSQLADFYFFQITAKIAGGRKRYTKQYVEQLPIPPITSSNKGIVGQIERIVEKILSAKKQNPAADTSQSEREIDRLVYKLYELTEEEIAIVEGEKCMG